MRYTDMIRITENINYIMEAAREKGYTIHSSELAKTVWIHDDIISRTEWGEILSSLLAVADGIYYDYKTVPNYDMTFTNINIVEELTLRCKVLIEEITDMARLNHWVGDNLFSGDQVNAGGTY